MKNNNRKFMYTSTAIGSTFAVIGILLATAFSQRTDKIINPEPSTQMIERVITSTNAIRFRNAYANNKPSDMFKPNTDPTLDLGSSNSTSNGKVILSRSLWENLITNLTRQYRIESKRVYLEE